MNGGITLFHSKHKFTKEASGTLIPLTRFIGDFPEPTFHVQLAYGGQFAHDESIPKKFIIFRPGMGLFRHAKTVDLVAYLDGTHDSQMIGFSIPISYLKLLLGLDGIKFLLESLNLASAPAVEVHDAPSKLTALILSALSTNLTGKAKSMHVQGKILEFFNLLHQSLSENIGNANDNLPLAEKIKGYLLAAQLKVITLDELSKEFNISARYLNQVFINEFQESIASFSSNYRLAQAKHILENTKTPMKILSANLGYSHVNHFISAFKRKFGVTPGSLRK
jgi:AraC-like DNA-binding protein